MSRYDVFILILIKTILKLNGIKMKHNKPLFLASLLSLSVLTACGGGSSVDDYTPTNNVNALQPHAVSSENLQNINVLSRNTFPAPAVTTNANSITITHTLPSRQLPSAHYQFFLNIDNDAATGFRFDGEAWDNAGTDYIVEDGRLFKSTSNDTSWSWDENVGEVSYQETDSTVSVTIKKSLLQGLKPVVRIGFMPRDANWNVKAIYPRSSLMAEYTLDIVPPVDSVAPVISLNGSSTLIIQQSSDFSDPGATAKDNVDGVISDQIVADSTVDTSQVGTYKISYSVTDRAGNTGTAIRIVKVIASVPNGIVIDGNTSDWITIPDTSNSPAGIIKASNKNGKLYLMINAPNIGENTQIFLDTDNDSATGFQFGGDIWNQGGADYMIENNHLDKAKVNSATWSWDYNIGRIETARSGDIVEVAIPTGLLANLGNTMNIGFVNRDAEWNVKYAVPETTLVGYTLDQIPPPSGTVKPLILKIDSHYKKCTRPPRYSNPVCTYYEEFSINTKGTGYNYNVDCNSDGIFEAQNITTKYVCKYDTRGEYRVSISGKFPHLYNAKQVLDVEQWGTQKWDSLESAFLKSRRPLNISATDTPNLTHVKSMEKMFSDINFDQASSSHSFNDWDTSNVINMSSVFLGSDFNQNIGNWDTSNVTNMTSMFAGSNFNQNIGNWNTNKVTSMNSMFSGNRDFNQDIGQWDVSNVVDMQDIFASGNQFNQNISNWDVSNVTNMGGMFAYNRAFNQDIGSWNVSNVTNMLSMFLENDKFDQDISRWDVSKVRDMYFMFAYAKNFNQDLGSWDVSNVENMSNMFYKAELFNQDISKWDISNVRSDLFWGKGFDGFLEGTSFSTTHYDKLLNAWSNLQNLNAMPLDVGNTKYSSASASAREKLISQFGWIITDGGQTFTPFANTPNVTSIVEASGKWFGISGKSVLQDDGANVTTIFTSPNSVSALTTAITGKLHFISLKNKGSQCRCNHRGSGKLVELHSYDISSAQDSVVLAKFGVSIINSDMKDFLLVSAHHGTPGSRQQHPTNFYKIDKEDQSIYVGKRYHGTSFFVESADTINNILHVKIRTVVDSSLVYTLKKLTSAVGIGLEDE